MGDQEQINAGVGDAIIKLLLRVQIVTEEDVLAIADEYDMLAKRAQAAHDTDLNEGIAHSLRCSLMSSDPPPAVDPAREIEVQFQRQQIRTRTAMIERQGKE